MSYNQIFVESDKEGYPISIFTDSELKFLKSKELINIKDDKFQPSFVGEFVTPENSYFSLPKNFQSTPENVELFKKVLIRYKELKGKDGKTLLTNNSFAISSTGDIKSEKFYYNELKEFFLDFITYEYIYPKKTILKHSTSPISGGKIDVFSTMRNRKQKGPGITYKTKDIENTPDWNLDDIYWSTIKSLANLYASEDDVKQISEMREFLLDEGYILNEIDLSNKDKVISNINKCEVGIIHQPIKNILLDYYESKSIGERFSINAFYTLKFQYVWEELTRESLKHSDNFKSSVKEEFNKPMRRRFREDPTGYRDLMPDIFSSYSGKSFIGDAKYYKDPENSHFDKEMYVYNQLIDNKYPMCVFIPSDITKRLEVRDQGEFELIVFLISVQEAIQDAVENSDRTIIKVMNLIGKNTERKGDDYLGGF
jgi:hypothetical protein